ncbi:MAG: hypothetical protein H7196_01320 [candidate division SR1 bacterium]|nr:hypothetical protein [candidate division SR1 bacterium]
MNIVGSFSINGFLKISYIGNVYARYLYKYFASYSSIKQSKLRNEIKSEESFSFTDLIKPFSVIRDGNTILLNLYGLHLPGRK